MNKEQLLQFVSKAIDMGAHLGISFYSVNKFSEESAKEIAEEFAQVVGEEASESVSEDGITRWFSVDGNYHLSAFHENSRDEKYRKEEETA